MEKDKQELMCDGIWREKDCTLIMLDSIPVCCYLWNKEYNIIDCNLETVSQFGLSNKQEFIDNFFSFSPQYQPDGQQSVDKIRTMLKKTSTLGRVKFEWMHQKLDGELIPSEITLVRIEYKGEYIISGYIRNLKDLNATVEIFGQLEKLIYIDTLTDSYNRRYFMEAAGKQFAAYKCDGKPISIVMMDIDKFKNVNDTYGHLFGDEVLKQITVITKKVLRPYDLFARYGGEEFIILILNSDKELAVKLSWRIQKAIMDTKIAYDNKEVNVTVSLGVAVKTTVNQSLEEVIQKADQAMYKAKESGRNTVVVDET